jgi:colanic acid biosynthesis protein WcaH
VAAVRLSPAEFTQVVRLTPLVSIDLVVRNAAGEMLVGWRRNRPARDTWFVPGGRIGKDERIAAAFTRLAQDELNAALRIEDARFLGVFEHLYGDNFAGEPGFGTHYVVLAYAVQAAADLALPEAQHSRYRWISDAALLADPAVHANTRAYAGL